MKILKKLLSYFMLSTALFACADEDSSQESTIGDSGSVEIRFSSYKGLVMTGYQGWFNTPNDGMGMGWTHYLLQNVFEPGCCSIDFWPEMDEYEKKYLTSFSFQNGNGAYVFSSADYSTTDLHFKWMQEYGIDGIFLQRFLSATRNETNKAHRAQVTENVIRASKRYDRAWCMMYDIGDETAAEICDLAIDWAEIEAQYGISDLERNPNYLYHNGKPLLAIYGVGFSTKEDDGSFISSELLEVLESNGIFEKYSIMLGTPYYWESMSGDATDDPGFHELIKRCDIILPWAVGRYKDENYDEGETSKIAGNLAWCRENGVDYAQLIFPGFSWGNLKLDHTIYDASPRNSGDFMWHQIWGAYTQGVEMYYMAMFDEVDEGTAIFKCLHQEDVPMNGDGKFVGYDSDIKSDHYLWLAGEAKKLLHDATKYSEIQPSRE